LSRSASISRLGLTASTGSWREVQDLKPQPGLLFYIALLACISFMSFGSYYSYDTISALEDHISNDLDLTGFQFGLLSSVYALPNIVVVLIGGFFIDKYGNKASANVLCALVAVGTGIVAISYYMPNKQWTFYIMLAGRFIFGFVIYLSFHSYTFTKAALE
jgi:MFS family permease